jgi:6-pyruvoyltetrahydropterin/6-carboxytetrahydropterin synthase
MMPTITRILDADYGHRVWGHEGKCASIHGHRATIEVTVQADELDSIGRVIDFSQIKTLIGGWIDKEIDHRLILNPADPICEIARDTPEEDFGKGPFLMPEGNPTAELLAKLIFNKCEELLPKEIKIKSIRFWETPNSYADYSGE